MSENDTEEGGTKSCPRFGAEGEGTSMHRVDSLWDPPAQVGPFLHQPGQKSRWPTYARHSLKRVSHMGFNPNHENWKQLGVVRGYLGNFVDLFGFRDFILVVCDGLWIVLEPI